MIPLKLSVRNFLSYRENVPALDFTGVHVACLCGNNGHGKSALLDAITWCLWGKARGRTQDELISYGSSEARTELEFSCRDSRFRVIRSHSRGRARGRPGSTDLQLQALTGEEAQSISGNTVRETQARIEQLIGMNYDTFINSAFLMQGRADEFTSKTPAERKVILASLLDLEAYDQLQERARRRLDIARTGGERSEAVLEQARRQAEEIGDPAGELAGVDQYLGEVETRLTQARAAEETLRGQVAEAARQRAGLAELRGQIDSSQQELVHLEAQVSSGEQRVQQFRNVKAQADEITEGVRRLREAERSFEVLEQARARADELTRAVAEVSQSVARQKTQLEARLDQLSHRIAAELAPKSRAEPELAAALGEVHRQLETLTGEDEALGRERDRQQVLAAQIGEAQSLSERHRTEGLEIRSKLDLLEQTPGDQAVCPLCQTPLGQDGCGRLAESYRGEIQAMRNLYRNAHNDLKHLEEEQTALQKSLPQRERALTRRRRDAQLKLQDLERQLSESKTAQLEIERLNPELTAGRAALESGQFAAEETAQLQQMKRQLDALGYQESTRQQRYAEIRSLQEFETRQRELSQALKSLPDEEAALSQTKALSQRRQKELAGQEERLQTVKVSLAELPDLEGQLRAASIAVGEHESNRQNALSRRGFLEGQVNRRAELLEEIAAHSSRLQAFETEQAVFQELATAFGRQGVQTMLIETVVPRLEEEANLLLGRMTDNQMHVKLETQRERRSGRGEAIETLEINVSDDLGPRSYEMYSGGEAFRVNLALRIALSKVLAQRMGAPLPTLFIDEGFGTQDSAGRERILDVISAIQDEFDKIIVITHLDDLKDMFPVRIEVQKDENGSTFWLS
jgi:exonuclease SbcC